jgi:ABC-type nitrate/sulfonate/bicarbonate transport system substrate-binding protein
MNAMKAFKACALWIVVVACTSGIFPSASRAADADVVRLMFNPGLYDELPFMLAIDKGYFTDEHLDVRVTKAPGSLGLIVPYLARGDIDVAPQVMGPAFFNQYTEGFGIKIVAPIDEAHKGWNETVYFMVRQDAWDSKAIRKPADLRGKKLPKPNGSPNDVLAFDILAKAGLTMSNVIMNVGITGATTNFLPALRNKQYDAMSVPEPIASQFEKLGIAHKWLSYQDVLPSFQTAYLAIGPAFARDHHDAAERFVRAFMRACRDIASANGKWTPELIDSESKWSGLDRNAITAIPGPTYPGTGKIDVDSIRRQEELWLSLNMLKKSVPIAALIDDSYARNARAALGIK